MVLFIKSTVLSLSHSIFFTVDIKKKHCFSTQIIVDARGHIRFAQSGFHGRMNDAGQFLQLPRIGPGLPLDFPAVCYILGDKGYANRYPVITLFRRNHPAANQADRDAQSTFNEELSRCRVIVEHTFSSLKYY